MNFDDNEKLHKDFIKRFVECRIATENEQSMFLPDMTLVNEIDEFPGYKLLEIKTVLDGKPLVFFQTHGTNGAEFDDLLRNKVKVLYAIAIEKLKVIFFLTDEEIVYHIMKYGEYCPNGQTGYVPFLNVPRVYRVPPEYRSSRASIHSYYSSPINSLEVRRTKLKFFNHEVWIGKQRGC